MNRKLAIVLFVATALLQAAAPLSMIARREAVLRHGAQFRFKTAPVDPYDAMRGRYVALGIRPDTAPRPEGGAAVTPGQKVYAMLERDAEGFAQISGLATDTPRTGDFLAVRIAGGVYMQNDAVRVDLPFNRYYMEESMAPRAESLYRQAARQDGGEGENAYVTVRIKDGLGVIENLYIDGLKIEDALKEQK